jgi:NAD(P)-dependent dehydrogenase (short-subunit alcohol dehydrogenase family)
MTVIQLKPIHDQVVAIIGASSGIGRETALKFAQKGAKLAVCARSESGLASLVDEITKIGGEAIAIKADVSDFEQVQAIADKTVLQYGRLDTWVHVAATGLVAPFEKTTPEEFKRVIDVNLMGQVHGAMAALPYIRRERRGALIHVTSVEARRSLPLQSAYAASKHGVEGFLDSLRVELMNEGMPISVTNILPAVINTPFYNKAKTKLGVQPMGVPPYYQPSLVAEAILHVAEHPMRDFIVGDVGRILDLLQKLSPQLLDAALQLAISGQHTNKPKSEDDTNNFYEPTEEYNKAEGDFSHLAIPSISDWIVKNNPFGQWGGAATFGALALLAMQALNNRKSN